MELPIAQEEKKKRPAKGERKVQILQILAQMLETPNGGKITTAALAARLDVSEAALYRHFASKAQMFEGLIEFVESSLLTMLNQISKSELDGLSKLKKMMYALLAFAQTNQGMAKVMIGDALVHENERLQSRVNQLVERLQATLKQALRDYVIEQGWQPASNLNDISEFWMNWVVGRWHQFVRSQFNISLTDGFEEQWFILQASLILPHQ